MSHAQRRVVVTGSAGFIGSHLSQQLLDRGCEVLGIDSLTDYYDVGLKRDRLHRLEAHSTYRHDLVSLEDPRATEVIASFEPHDIVHLAAQAGVRYALEAPATYVDSNILGTFHVLEGARIAASRHLLFASTSSVYGANTTVPYSERDPADHPLSFYAATKKAGETLIHSYSHLHGLPATCFRFFTVYGPWGRPDMALFKFVRAVLDGKVLPVHGDGTMRRDFTYVDDLVNAILLLAEAAPALGDSRSPDDTLSPAAPYRVVNIGGGQPLSVLDLVASVEKATGMTARLENVPVVAGEVAVTHADSRLLDQLTGYVPQTALDEGVQHFVDWYREYYSV